MKLFARTKRPAPTPQQKLRRNRQWLIGIGILLFCAGVDTLLLIRASQAVPLDKVYESVGSLKDCQLEDAKYKCYEAYYQGLTKVSTARAFEDMRAQYEADGYVRSQCHQLAHVVGRASIARYNNDVAEAYANGDHFCSSGYHHGIMEGLIANVGIDGLIRDLPQLCDKVAEANRYSIDHHNCTHGLGHGVMGIRNMDLNAAVADCELLKDNWEQSSCSGGVFMENLMTALRGDENPSKFLRPTDPMYPCTEVENQHKSPCYLIQSSYALNQYGGDFKRTFEACTATPDVTFHSTCYMSVGRDASGTTYSDVQRTIANCKLSDNQNALYYCMVGAVYDFVYFYNGDSQARDLCKAFGTELEADCNRELDGYYKTYKGNA